MADLDQGGGLRLWERVYLGPSLGWVMFAATDLYRVTVPGTVTLDFGITLVQVHNVGGPVTVILPESIAPGGTPASPISVIDIGGNASVDNITILPSGSDSIMGLPSIAIMNDFGSFTLVPLATGGWVQQT